MWLSSAVTYHVTPCPLIPWLGHPILSQRCDLAMARSREIIPIPSTPTALLNCAISMLQEEHFPACSVCLEWACGLREQTAAAWLLWHASSQSLLMHLPAESSAPSGRLPASACCSTFTPQLGQQLTCCLCPLRGLGAQGTSPELQLTSHFCMGNLQETIHYSCPHTPHPAPLQTPIH